MIKAEDKITIETISRKYRISKVLLFGSSLSADIESRDIDIAIEGLADKDYFAFYGELMNWTEYVDTPLTDKELARVRMKRAGLA